MKSVYDKKGLQTAESQQFGINKEYLEMGFSVRDLSHEAQSVVRDCELDHIMITHLEDAKIKRRQKSELLEQPPREIG